ncbi:BON domain-containing protein [Marinobacter changyiensis]|uniref:BON domain-containing protein n=1 Tax=Marinobacter changyiensis TaxID=2604091 RepID=UPI001263FF10|nr:BON domain-containing protein [Marinobacter changyiensis]
MKVECRYLVLWLMLVSGCAGVDGTGMAEQDTPEEVRLKAVLFEAEDIAGSAINITINEDEILLEGFVETAVQKQRVEDLVRQNSGSGNVNNQITIK